MVKRHNRGVSQILVKWKECEKVDSTWEDYHSFVAQFLSFNFEDSPIDVAAGYTRRSIGSSKSKVNARTYLINNKKDSRGSHCALAIGREYALRGN